MTGIPTSSIPAPTPGKRPNWSFYLTTRAVSEFTNEEIKNGIFSRAAVKNVSEEMEDRFMTTLEKMEKEIEQRVVTATEKKVKTETFLTNKYGQCYYLPMEGREVSVYEAKTHLSELLRKVETGEEIIIRRGKHAVAKLISASKGTYVSIPDTAKGEIWMADDFNEPLEAFSEYTG
jgi:prevent-host-death family protein